MRPIKSSLKTTTVSHLYLQILLEQEILAWHKRLFKNRFAGEAQYRLCEKTLGFFFCKQQAPKKPASHFSACNKLPKHPFGAMGRVFSSICWRAAQPLLKTDWKAVAHTSANWQPFPGSCVLLTHPVRTPPRQHKHRGQAGVKEMCKISTNHCSEDKAVWLSPGTLRLLINY